MDAETSSAEPHALFAYANSGLRIDAQLEASAARLAVALDEFASTCREYSLGINSSIAQRLREYARRTSEHDLWVRRVGEQFVLADQGLAAGNGLAMATLDSGTSVADWSAATRIEAALERAVSKLPSALAEQLRALLTPENVAALVAILGIWAASQAFGIGEIVDLILAVGGVIMLGPEAIRAVQNLVEFTTGAVGAQDYADLDQAGEHLATAVAIVGVDGAMALLAHKAGGAIKEGAPSLTTAEAELVTPDGIRVRVSDPVERLPGWDKPAEPWTLEKTVGEVASQMTADAYGPARVNEPQAFERIMTDLRQAGVQVNLSESTPPGQGAYGPSPVAGRPGSLNVNPDTDISTLLHEYDHFLFDRANGFPGLRQYIEDPHLLIDGEIRAYDVEISHAQANGLTELAATLSAAKQEVIGTLKTRYGL